MPTRGQLYIVATPIGHLDDISARALHILGSVDKIAAEDTRHSAHLLQHFGIRTPLFSLHEHNERARIEQVITWLEQGLSIALISDAGTPLISDPGFPLVRAARAAQHMVIPIPGACALITALSVAGLPTDRFIFEGFLPAKSQQRINHLNTLQTESRTLIFYESSHRISDMLHDCATVFGAQRQAVVAREMTKQYEEFLSAPLSELAEKFIARARGEFVVMIHGLTEQDPEQAELDRVLHILLLDLPIKQASALAAKLTGFKKNQAYTRALTLQATTTTP